VESGISKSQVSRICAELDEVAAEFRNRPLGHVEFPYLLLDATYVKAHQGAQVVSKAIVIATGISATGEREVLGLEVGDSEDGAFWTAFLRSLRARGLKGVKLVISDAHEGLKTAIQAVMLGAAWQRCRVHFARNCLSQVPKGSVEMVAAAVRTIFNQPTAAECSAQLDKMAIMLGRQFPKVEQMLTEAKADLLAFSAFPQPHWRKLWSTNSLERVNKEIKRRSNVVGIFPNERSVTRLAGSILIEIHDEWAVADRRYLSQASMAKLYENHNDEPERKELEENKQLRAS
jgi:putative transposase